MSVPGTRVLSDQQGGSPCGKARGAGLVTCVVFLPVKTFSAVTEAVGEALGSPALSLGPGKEKSSSVMSLSSSALLQSSA